MRRYDSSETTLRASIRFMTFHMRRAAPEITTISRTRSRSAL